MSFVFSNINNWVELGRTANNQGETFPIAYKEWKLNGTDSGILFLQNPNMTQGQYYVFSIASGYQANPTKYALSIGGTPVGASPTMGFSTGWALTNSERRNNCDSWYAHFRNLDRCSAPIFNYCTEWNPYQDLHCYAMPPDHADYLFDEVADDAHYVRKLGGVTC